LSNLTLALLPPTPDRKVPCSTLGCKLFWEDALEGDLDLTWTPVVHWLDPTRPISPPPIQDH